MDKASKNMRKNNKNKETIFNKTTALVFDRYYGNNTNAAAVIAGRLVIAAALSFFCMSYVFSMYDLPLINVPFAVISMGFAVVFSLLFAVAGRCVTIPVIAFISGVVILCRFNSFWRRFSYFVDALILQCDGRLFSTTPHITHPFYMIMFGGKYTSSYTEGVIFGSVILCALFALITAAGLIGKPNIVPSLAAFVVLCAPVLASERLLFRWQIIPIIALYAGVIAIGSYYRDGLAIRHVYAAGGYRRKVTMDHKRFNSASRAQSIGRRTASRGLYYSKYFASVMSAVAMFAALGIVFNVIFADSTGINYDDFYAKLQNINIGVNFGGGTPFKNGPAASYFASPANSVFGTNNRLRLTSPSTGTKEILRVTKPVTVKPIYLRGDVGIDFDGTSWSSSVVEEPDDWRGSGLDESWLPVEMPMLVEASDTWYDFGFGTIGMTANVGVEYLCDTDVVFTPAYDEQYKAFTDSGLDIFGDYAARRKTDKATGEVIRYTALLPFYSTPDNDNEALDIREFRMVCDVYRGYIDNYYMNGGNDINRKLSLDFAALKNIHVGEGVYDTYKKYVYDHYLEVPYDLLPRLDKYLQSSGLDEQITQAKHRYSGTFDYYYDGGNTSVLIDRFLTAKTVSDFLKENYTYSLDAKIDRQDPVMSFLNDAKKGHCALYASSMTLILRDLGVPARYCTGFAVDASITAQTMRSKDLHAWCEVYLDELGWVTFDPTSAAIFDGSGGTENSDSSDSSGDIGVVSSSVSSEQSGEVSSVQSGTSSDQQSSDTHTPSSDGSSLTWFSNSGELSSSGTVGETLTFAQVLPYILTVLGICAVIAFIVLVVIAYNNLRKRAYKQVQTYHRAEDSDYVYAKLLAVLRFCKLSPQSGEQPHEFFERVEITLDCSICDNYDILQRLAFGKEELDESERAILGRTFEKIYRTAESRYKLFGKIKLRLLVLSRKV